MDDPNIAPRIPSDWRTDRDFLIHTEAMVENIHSMMLEAMVLIQEIHAMSKDGHDLLNSPGVAAMRKFTGRSPLLGGRRG